MKKDEKRLQGKFIADVSDETLKKNRRLRAALQAVMLVCFIAPPLIFDLEAAAVFAEKNYTPLLTVYVALLIFTALWSVYSFICCFNRYSLRKEIPKNDEPKNGFEKHTWAVIEWQFYLTALCAAAHVACIIYAFSWTSLGVVLPSVAAAICAYFIKAVSFKTYDGKLTFVSLDEELEKTDDVTPDIANVKAADTNLKTYNENAEKNLAEEIEDFYDRD